MNVGIFTTHPIQYQVPWFRALHDTDEIELTVYYDHLPNPEEQGEGFETAFSWDIPLLDGYSWRVCNEKQVSSERECSLYKAVSSNEIVLVTGWQAIYLIKVTLLGFMIGRPIIVRGESSGLKPRPLFVKLLHQLYLKIFDKFLYIGNSNKVFYKKNGVKEDNLYPCRYFVENERFDEDYRRLRPERKNLRSKLRVPEDAVCFLFAGKLVDKKCPLAPIEALRRLDGVREQLHLLMVGDGELMSKAQRRAQKYEGSVTFTGFLNQSEIGKAYTVADVLILPSDYDETWGLVVNESMIFEVPAIVSDRVGCGPDLVDEDETGYVFPFGNINELSKRMRKIASNSKKRDRMGRDARRQVMENYTVEEAVSGTLRAVRSAYRSN